MSYFYQRVLLHAEGQPSRKGHPLPGRAPAKEQHEIFMQISHQGHSNKAPDFPAFFNE